MPARRSRGTAVTVLLQPGDNWMLHVAAEQIQPGDIVVAAVTADCTDGYFGDLLATSFKARGARALVIDAGVRDVRTLDRDGLPGVEHVPSARKGTIKATLGSVNVPVVCAGALVTPGRRDRGRRRRRGRACPAARAAAGGRSRGSSAKPTKAPSATKLAAGVLGLDMYAMREPLAKAGLRYID